MRGKIAKLLRKSMKPNAGVDKEDKKFKGKHVGPYYEFKNKKGMRQIVLNPDCLRARYKTLKNFYKAGMIKTSAIIKTIENRRVA